MLKLSKLYKVNHVGVNMNYMYKLPCIMIIMKSLESCIPLWQLSFESLYARLCSSTLATSRKQVTISLYIVIINLILIPQFSSHLNESCYTSNVSRATQLLEETELMTDILQKIVMRRHDRHSKNLSLPTSAAFSNVPLGALKIKINCMFLFI